VAETSQLYAEFLQQSTRTSAAKEAYYLLSAAKLRAEMGIQGIYSIHVDILIFGKDTYVGMLGSYDLKMP